MDGIFDPLLTADVLAGTKKRLSSLHHTDILSVDLAYSLAAAGMLNTDPAITDFLENYVALAIERAALFEAQIIQDEITLKTRRLDPAKIVQDFLTYQEGERKFKEFVHEAAKKFAPLENHSEETDLLLYKLAAFYNKIRQPVDRIDNLAVRENLFDRSRVKDIAKLRELYSLDKPFSRREGVIVPHGATGPGFFERLLWREEAADSDRHVYGEGPEELKKLAIDIGNVCIRQTNTAHPTEIETGEAIDAFADEYEMKRRFAAATTTDQMREAATELLEHRRKILNPDFSLIKLAPDGSIDNFTPLDEIKNVHNRSGLLTRVRGLEDCYYTSWRAMNGGFPGLVTPQFLVDDFNIDYEEATWVPTDYDGAYLKLSEHPLPHAVLNMLNMIEHYTGGLSEAKENNLHVPASDGGPVWLDRMQEAEKDLNAILEKIMLGVSGRELILSQTAFTQILDDIDDVLQKLGNGRSYDDTVTTLRKDFEQAFLENVNTNTEQAYKMLVLSKTVRSRGLRGEKLEYRQTSERHAEMVHHLLNIPVPGKEPFDYRGPKKLEELPQEEREERYAIRRKFANEQSLKDPNFLDPHVAAFYADCGEGTDLRNTRDTKPLLFHTGRVMQMFARFPHFGDRMVLAEYEDVANYADAVLLQKALRDPKTGRQASLDVAPLLERVTILNRWKDLLIQIFTTPITVAHLATRGFKQFVQAAYSDNTKRFGITTRQAITGMWRSIVPFVESYTREYGPKILGALKNAGVTVQDSISKLIKVLPYHGQSLLRPDHGGQFMLTARMKQDSAPFVEHLDGKVHIDLTAQNHDVTVLFSTQDGFKRHIMRLVTEGSQLAAFEREGRETRRHAASPELTELVSKALQDLQPNYDRDYAADNSPHCHALAYPLIDNSTVSAEGNASPRGANRNATGKPEQNIYARGPDNDYTVPVPQDAMRAITLSEDQVLAGSRISYAGTAATEKNLNRDFERDPVCKAQLQDFTQNDAARLGFKKGTRAFDDEGNLTIAGLQTLSSARVLPPFRTHVDEIGFGPISSSGVPDYAQRQIWAKEQGLPITAKVQEDLDNRRRDSLAAAQLKLKCSGIDPRQFKLPDCIIDTRIEFNYYLLRRLSDMRQSTGELELARLLNTFDTYGRDQLQIRRWLEGNDKGDRPPTLLESKTLREFADSIHCLSMPNLKTVHDYPYAARRKEELVKDAQRPLEDPAYSRHVAKVGLNLF